MSGQALTGYRNVTITITGAAPLDFHKAVNKKVEEIEYATAQNAAAVTDITAQPVLLTGKTPFSLYKATFTSVKATGTYTAVFVGEFANAAEANAVEEEEGGA